MLNIIILSLSGISIIFFFVMLLLIKKPWLAKEKYLKIIVFIFSILCVFCSIVFSIIYKQNKINYADIIFNNGDYISAIEIYEEFGCTDKYIEAKYLYAIQLYSEKNYTDAKEIFNDLNDYKKSDQYIEKIELALLTEHLETTYSIALNFYEQGKYGKAYEYLNSIKDYKDSSDIISRLQNAHSISVGIFSAIGIKKDGNIVHTKNMDKYDNNFYFSNWNDIVSISYMEQYAVALRIDGTVVSTGKKKIDTQEWNNIIAVSAGEKFVVGLKNDGTVVAYGHNAEGQCNVSDWANIVAIATGWRHTVGLDKNGNLYFAGHVSNKTRNAAEQIEDKDKIVAIAAGGGDKNIGKGHTVVLRADGTVDAVGDNTFGQCNVKEWTGIVAIAAGDWHTVGLKADGTVITTKPDEETLKQYPDLYTGACDVGEWNGIVEISAGSGLTVGLQSDGTLKVVGYNSQGQRERIEQMGENNKIPPRQHLFDDFVK